MHPDLLVLWAVINMNEAEIIAKLFPVFSAIPFHHTLGLKLEHIEPQHVVITFTMKNELIGNFLHGILHGGVISSVLDTAGGIAVMASAISKHPDRSLEELADVIGKCSTIDLHVNFLNPGHGKTFLTKAWVVKGGKKISFARMELSNEENKLIATATGTYLIIQDKM